MINVGESAEDAAKREALEETGMVIDHIMQLGEIPPDTGTVSAVIPIFIAQVIHRQNAAPEDSEAIEEIFTLSISEIKAAFARGCLEVKIRGKTCKVPFRDPFLAYALLITELYRR